jgi:Tol biopolymer transport system component
VRRDGSRLRRLTDTERVDAEIANTSPDYSPDGRHIVFQRYGYRENLGMHVMRVDGSGERPIPGTDGAGAPAYAPDGKLIVATIATGVALYFSCSDVYTMSPTASDMQRLTDYCNPRPDGSGSTLSAYSPSWQQPLPGAP